MQKNNSSSGEVSSKIIHRIARIEGQFQGVRKMIENKKNCVDILRQLMAVREAVSMLGVKLLKDDLNCKNNKGKGLDEAYLKTIFKIK